MIEVGNEMGELQIESEGIGDDSPKMAIPTILKRLISYVGRQNRSLIVPLILFISLNIIFSWLSPLIFKFFIDQGLGNVLTAGGGSGDANLEIILFAGVLFFIISISSVICKILQGFIIQKLATITMYNLRYELFTKFQYLGLDYHDSPKISTGKRISYLTNDVNTIQELINSGLLSIVANLFLIFGALGFMIILSIHLTLVAFLIIPLLFIVGGIIFKTARKYFEELRERVSHVTSTLDESIMGMKVIKSFAVEDENYEELNGATLKEKEAKLDAAKLNALIPGVTTLVITLGLILLFLSAGMFIREGLITIGTLVAFIFYLFQFFEPLIGTIAFFTLLQNSIAAGGRIITLLDKQPSIQESKTAKNPNSLEGKIQYDTVDFYYEQDQPVLENINLKIKKAERLALVGYTGAGKSTFVKLLCRFYDPIQGSITIDGYDLKELKLDAIRTNIGIVMQESFLFSTTVMENIRYGKLDASDEEIIEVAKKVNAHKFIMELENGYQTQVGERGNQLSEGQKQLISFARTLISNPPILILDEATSAVDPYSELLIQEALETLLEGRTSISIAHRLSTIINSDRILVLDNGKIIEAGTHQELLENGGFYSQLFEMQFKDPFKKVNIKKE